jgi:hypothetical protein
VVLLTVVVVSALQEHAVLVHVLIRAAVMETMVTSVPAFLIVPERLAAKAMIVAASVLLDIAAAVAVPMPVAMVTDMATVMVTDIMDISAFTNI